MVKKKNNNNKKGLMTKNIAHAAYFIVHFFGRNCFARL